VVKLGRDTLLCYGEKMVLKPHISYAIRRSWQDGSNADSIIVDKPGKYVMTVSNNCGTASDTINVHYIRQPQLHFGSDTFICGKPDFWLDATSDSAVYAWQDGSNGPKLHVTSAGKYSVTVKNHCGVASQSIIVRPKNPIYIELGKDTDLCAGATLVLHAKAVNAVNYLWQDGSTDSVYTVSKPGWYRVQLSNPCSQALDSIYVDYTNPPDPHFSNDTLICGLSEFTLDATSDKATYFWNDGSRESHYTVTTSGTYGVVVKNHCGTARRSIHVKMSNPPSVFLGNDTTICDSTTLMAGEGNNGYRYHWQDGSTANKLKISSSGTYAVTVSNECGTVRDSIIINVEQCECPLYTPNSFTPNGDGLNETFKPSSCDPKEYVLRIFNRWGELLFESHDISKGWNGTFEGNTVPEGAYLYTIRGANKSSGFFNKSGIVYVLLPRR
jgi:gliding motility-associated-like protein